MKSTRVRSFRAVCSASTFSRHSPSTTSSGTSRGTAPTSRTRLMHPRVRRVCDDHLVAGVGHAEEGVDHCFALATGDDDLPRPVVARATRRSMYAATASFMSSRPVNGSQLFASSSPSAARVASTASGGGGMSVSRFSIRSTSGSSPAAAATRSIDETGDVIESAYAHAWRNPTIRSHGLRDARDPRGPGAGPGDRLGDGARSTRPPRTRRRRSASTRATTTRASRTRRARPSRPVSRRSRALTTASRSRRASARRRRSCTSSRRGSASCR